MATTPQPPPRGQSGDAKGPADWDNPLDFIAEDHMREREVCALIDQMVARARVHEAEFEQVLEFLAIQLPLHLEDEEIDLFPLMLKRCEPEDEIGRVIVKLQLDHDHAIADAPSIVAIIRGFKAKRPNPTQSDQQQMTDFAYHARRHLILENAIILPIARARLTEDDLATMKRHMLDRRGLQSQEGTSDAQ